MKITSALLLSACLAIANVEAKSLNKEKVFAAKLRSPKATLIDIPTEAEAKAAEIEPVKDFEPLPEVSDDATVEILEPVIIAPVDINSIVNEQTEAQARQEADEKA
jgi:hypothetical protein